eukprot:gene7154-7910_t
MACSDASEPRKTVPRSFLWSFGIAAVSAVLLIITVGCNAPGVAYYAIPETNALFYGYAKGLHIDHRVARLQRRFSTLQRSLTQPLGMYAVYYSLTVYFGMFVSFFIFYPQYYTAVWVFAIYMALVSVWYFSQVRSRQKFSTKEQEVMFQAYVINANFFRRKNIRGAHSTSNTPNMSPAPSSSNMQRRSTKLLSRVAACLSMITRVQTRQQRGVKYIPTDNSESRNVSNKDGYSSTITRESRPLQSYRWEGHEPAIPVHGRSSLFSLSSDLVEYEVRRHPAYDNKGHQNASSAKYRIAPDSEYVAEKELFLSGNTIGEWYGFI